MINKLINAIAAPFKLMFGIDPDRDRILSTGRSAVAKIVDIGEAGPGQVTVNNNPYVKLTLEVYDGTKDPYTTELKRVISRLEVAQFQPGVMVNIKIDPLDPQKVVFDTTATPGERLKVGNTDQAEFTDGVKGTAEVLGIKKSDKEKNNQTVYIIDFEITSEDFGKYPLTKEVPLPDFAVPYFVVGRKYACEISKADKKRVKVDVNFQ